MGAQTRAGRAALGCSGNGRGTDQRGGLIWNSCLNSILLPLRGGTGHFYRIRTQSLEGVFEAFIYLSVNNLVDLRKCFFLKKMHTYEIVGKIVIEANTHLNETVVIYLGGGDLILK